jgi:hypothetical protein
VECFTEFSPKDLVVVLESGGVAHPLGSCRTSKLLGCIQSLLILYTV